MPEKKTEYATGRDTERHKEVRESQIGRGMRVLEVLFSDPINGVSNKEIIEKTQYHGAEVCRRLADLEEIGWVEKNDLERWAPTVKSVGLLKKYNLKISELTEKIDNFELRSNAYARR